MEVAIYVDIVNLAHYAEVFNLVPVVRDAAHDRSLPLSPSISALKAASILTLDVEPNPVDDGLRAVMLLPVTTLLVEEDLGSVGAGVVVHRLMAAPAHDVPDANDAPRTVRGPAVGHYRSPMGSSRAGAYA